MLRQVERVVNLVLFWGASHFGTSVVRALAWRLSAGPSSTGGPAKLRVLSLFAGIGAIDLGLERTGGFETVAVSEVAPYASAVLRKRFPDAVHVGDVREAAFPDADVIVAGFPCQDLSNAGKRAGLSGERSGLFWEVVRAVRLVRPRIVLLENVAALHGRGLGEVVGALAALGFDTEVHCIPASFVGAPHDRDRTWIVAHAFGGERWAEQYGRALGRVGRKQQSVPWDRDWQGALRELRGVDDGSTYRVDRVDTIRNAVVPQVAELIGHAILAAERDLAPRQHGPASPERGDGFSNYLAHQAGVTLSHAVGDTNVGQQ